MRCNFTDHYVCQHESAVRLLCHGAENVNCGLLGCDAHRYPKDRGDTFPPEVGHECAVI